MPADTSNTHPDTAATQEPHSAKQRQLRAALGTFATGVTIVTTTDADGLPVGVTASSFNSVSLDPPLILWSLAKSSLSYAAFAASGHFAVHVLADDQADLSARFARSQSDKWEGLEWRKGEEGSPLLNECLSLFECRTHAQYDGGDHVIFVGEVVGFEAHDKDPLLFHAGRYAQIGASGEDS
jgi:3-hydroxy-9,10-secoandrosta-1,3,5(10)-triene-9,17-dione monooxygenase reductase component